MGLPNKVVLFKNSRTPRFLKYGKWIKVKKILGPWIFYILEFNSDRDEGLENSYSDCGGRLARQFRFDGKVLASDAGLEVMDAPKRRRLGWKPSDDIPRRREHFHHSAKFLVNRIIRESERQS